MIHDDFAVPEETSMTQVDIPQGRLLRLEYVCTPAERKEAEALNLRQQFGGGWKVLTWVVLLAILALVLWMAWRMIEQMLPEGYRLYGVAGLAVFVVAFTWFQTKRDARTPPSAVTRVELSENGFRLGEGIPGIFIAWGNVARCLESENLFVFHDAPKKLAYILPKRVLPDDTWVDWLRKVAHSSKHTETASSVSQPAARIDSEVFRLNYRLGYWSMVDLLQASWMGKGIMLGWLALHLYVICTAVSKPAPDAKVPMWEVLVYFELPAIIVGAYLLLLFVAAYSWLQHRRELTPWRVEMGENVLRHVSAAGDVVVSWESLNRFKETPWHFILWRRPGDNWLMVPKRVLGGKQGVRRCRELLERHLQRSIWLTAH